MNTPIRRTTPVKASEPSDLQPLEEIRMTLEKVGTPVKTSEPSVTEPLEATVLIPPKAINTEKKDNFNELLSSIIDIKPSVSNELAILYKGINVTHEDHPIIKKLPIVFRWNRRGDNSANVIDSGNGVFVCGNWQVFRPNSPIYADLFKDLTIYRNDTASGDFVTHAELILCIAKKQQYHERQESKARAGLVAAIRDRENRIEQGQNVAKIKEPEVALKHLSDLNQGEQRRKEQQDISLEALRRQL